MATVTDLNGVVTSLLEHFVIYVGLFSPIAVQNNDNGYFLYNVCKFAFN